VNAHVLCDSKDRVKHPRNSDRGDDVERLEIVRVRSVRGGGNIVAANKIAD